MIPSFTSFHRSGIRAMAISLFLFVSVHFVHGQLGVQLNTDKAMPGYVLISNGPTASLINNCGEIVHEWDTGLNPSLHYKLLPNGNLIYISSRGVREISWEGDLVNTGYTSEVNLTYEVIVLPNGNYLCVARRPLDAISSEALGFEQRFAQIDIVVELDRESEEIVWEWNIGDHIIQERDSSAANFGDVSAYPRLLDVDAIGTVDWQFGESFMINGMDYNPELDQIALSVRKMGEVVIIDHSTTTEEARGSVGGQYGKGGDILYRWGDPANYRQGTEDDKHLFFQHNPNWIEHGPHKDKLIVFNNGLSRPAESPEDRYSSAEIIDPHIEPDGTYPMDTNGRFYPDNPDIIYNGDLSEDIDFYSSYLSGASVLENENIYITVGGDCKIVEFTPEGEIAWEYQYDSNRSCFRSEKYPLDYPAFEGKDLEPMGTIERPSSTYPCELITPTIELGDETVNIYYNNLLNSLVIDQNKYPLSGSLIDINGRVLQTNNILPGASQVDIKTEHSGIYFFILRNAGTGESSSFKFFIQ